MRGWLALDQKGQPMRIIIGTVIVSLATPAAAKVTYPASIPPECSQLAEREHVPNITANRYQALKAEYKLAHLNKADPMVAQCKDAVERAKAAARN